MSTQPGEARVVVIGAGIVGNSLVYHLSRLGWKDIVQIEKGPLPNPGGSTGHASNFIFLTDHSREMTALTADSVEQYKELGVFTRSGGIEVARTPERMEELKRRMASSRSWGIESELVTPEQIKAMVPYINTDIILGGFSTPGIGVVDSLRAGTLMREKAQALGALRLSPMTEVTGIDVEDGHVTRVRTDKGDFEADIVVIAAGVWSPRLASDGRCRDPAHPGGPPDDQRRAGPDARRHRRRDHLPDRPRHGHQLLRAPARQRHGGRLVRPSGDPDGCRRDPVDRRIEAVADRAAVHARGLRAPDGAGPRAHPRHPRRRAGRHPAPDQRPAVADPRRDADPGRDARGEGAVGGRRDLDQGGARDSQDGRRVDDRREARDRPARLGHRPLPRPPEGASPRQGALGRGLQQDLRHRPSERAVGQQPERPIEPVQRPRARARGRLLRDGRLGAAVLVRLQQGPARGVRRPGHAPHRRVGIALVVADHQRRAPGHARPGRDGRPVGVRHLRHQRARSVGPRPGDGRRADGRAGRAGRLHAAAQRGGRHQVGPDDHAARARTSSGS